MEFKLDHPGLENTINPVTFKKSKKAKYLRISINSELKISVIFPYRSNLKKAQNFLDSRINWVQNSLIKMKSKQITQNKYKKHQKTLSSEEFLKKSQYLIKKCHELAKTHSIAVKKVTLRRQKSIWGSCSAQNNISLNINLAFLDQELIDYVILHELAHVRVKNHGPKFWKLLENMLPEARKLDKKLKLYQPNFLKVDNMFKI